MMPSRGMGAMRSSKMPKGVRKARRDDTDFTEYADGGPVGLYANINAKQERIKAGSGEKMNKVGSKAAPSAADFRQAAKPAKPVKKK